MNDISFGLVFPTHDSANSRAELCREWPERLETTFAMLRKKQISCLPCGVLKMFIMSARPAISFGTHAFRAQEKSPQSSEPAFVLDLAPQGRVSMSLLWPE